MTAPYIYLAEMDGFEPSGQDRLARLLSRELPLAISATFPWLAGAEGLEPSTNGFGDHYSAD